MQKSLEYTPTAQVRTKIFILLFNKKIYLEKNILKDNISKISNHMYLPLFDIEFHLFENFEIFGKNFKTSKGIFIFIYSNDSDELNIIKLRKKFKFDEKEKEMEIFTIFQKSIDLMELTTKISNKLNFLSQNIKSKNLVIKISSEGKNSTITQENTIDITTDKRKEFEMNSSTIESLEKISKVLNMGYNIQKEFERFKIDCLNAFRDSAIFGNLEYFYIFEKISNLNDFLYQLKVEYTRPKSGVKLYKIINTAFKHLNYNSISKLKSILIGFLLNFNFQFKHEEHTNFSTVYRYTFLSNFQIEEFQEEQVIYSQQFISTTLNEDLNKNKFFENRDLKIIIKNIQYREQDFFYNYISLLNINSNEKQSEVLYAPFSKFKITKIENSPINPEIHLEQVYHNSLIQNIYDQHFTGNKSEFKNFDKDNYYNKCLYYYENLSKEYNTKETLNERSKILIKTGWMKQLMGKKEESLKDYDQVIEILGKNENLIDLALVYHDLSALYKDEDLYKSLEYIEKTKEIYAKIRDEPYPFYDSMAEIYANLGQFDEALKYYHLHFEQKQGGLIQFTNYAVLLSDLGQYDIAMSILKNLFDNYDKEYGKDVLTYELMNLHSAIAYVFLLGYNDYDKAFHHLSLKKEIYHSLFQNNESRHLLDIHKCMFIALARQKKLEKAEEDMEKLITLSKKLKIDCMEYAKILGMIISSCDDSTTGKKLELKYKELLLELLNGILNDKTSKFRADALFMMAIEFCLKESEYEKGLSFLLEYLSIDPKFQNKILVNLSIGQLYEKLKKNESSSIYYEKVILLIRDKSTFYNKQDLVTIIHIGIFEVNNYNFSKAKEYFSLAIDLSERIIFIKNEKTQKMIQLFNLMGTACKNLNQFKLAKSYYRKGITIMNKLEIQDSALLNNFGHIYIKLQKYGKAKMHLEQALKSYNENNKEIKSALLINLAISINSAPGSNCLDSIKYLKEAEILLENKSSLEYCHIFIEYGKIYEKMSNLEKSYQYFKDALNISLNIQEYSFFTYECYVNLSDHFKKKQNYEESCNFCKKEIQILSKINGDGCFDREITLSFMNLVEILIIMGKYSEAANILKENILDHINENIIGKEQQANLINSYGFCLQNLGNYNDAMINFKKALLLSKDFLHVKSLIFTNLLEIYFTNMKNYKEAINLFENVKEECVEYSKDKDWQYINIARSYKEIGNISNSIKFYEKGINSSIDKDLLYRSHNNLANIYHDSKNFSKALFHYEKSLEIRIELFGEDNEKVKLLYGNLFELYKDMGNKKEALKYLEKSTNHNAYCPQNLGIYLMLLDEFSKFDLEKAKLYNERIGFIYFRLQNFSEAIKFLEKAIDKDNEFKQQELLISLAICYKKMNKLAESKSIFDKLFALSIKHNDLKLKATCYNYFGEIYFKQKDFINAKKVFKLVFPLLLKLNDEELKSVFYKNRGDLYYFKKKYEKAAENLKLALPYFEKIQGKNTQIVDSLYYNIANCLILLNKHQDSLYYLEKSLEIQEIIYGVMHPRTTQTVNEISMVYSSKGDPKKAKKFVIDHFDKIKK